MIKRLLAALLVALTVTGASAQETKYLAWGVEAGLNVNKLSFSKDFFDSSNRLGFFVGPKIRVKLPILSFGVDGALLYSLNSAEVTSAITSETESRNLSYLEIPVNLRYDFDFRILSAYLATGPQFNYCVSGTSTLEDLYRGWDYSRGTWGWNVGAGVELFSHLQVGVTYTIPISSIDSFSGVVSDVIGNYKQKTVKVRLAYYF